jgi:hypothetical protein
MQHVNNFLVRKEQHTTNFIKEEQMKEQTYIWAWNDEHGVYINQAESLEEIIEDVVSYWTGGPNTSIKIELRDDQFVINFPGEEHQVEADENGVAEFLELLGNSYGRKDKFDIKIKF